MQDKKIIVVDVGCRWGFADEFVSNIDEFEIYGFDPDPIECKRLNEKYNNPAIRAVPLGLGDSEGDRVLYLTKEPACSSLYQPDPFLTENYAAFHCEVEVGKTTVKVVSLDQWCRENKVDWIDHLKIDTQGSELDILKGALDIIKTVRSIEVEVEFNPMYIGQPLFHDVDKFLRDQGFELWKFSEITHYSRNRQSGDAINAVDIRYDDWHSDPVKVYAGQLFWANAHYVRRGISSQRTDSVQYQRDAKLFSILGMPDVLGDQEVWPEEISKTMAKWVDRSNKVDRARVESSHALLQAEARAQQAEAASSQHLMQLNALYASISWRITAPLRQVGQAARWFICGSKAWLTFAPGSRPRRVLRNGLIWGVDKVRSKPVLKAWALKALSKFPRLQQRLRNITLGQAGRSHPLYLAKLSASQCNEIQHFPSRVGQIHADLKAAIEKNKKESV